MQNIFDIKFENFEEIVVKGSQERAVVVYFGATWSEPCKLMEAFLTKTSQEFNFVLAKIDVDTNQELTNYFQVSAIPDIRVVYQGRIADTIPAKLSDTQIKKRLSKFFLPPEALALIEADQLVQQGEPAQALIILEELLQQNPTDKKVHYCKAKALLDLGQNEESTSILQQFHEGDFYYREAKSLLELMSFHIILNQPVSSDPIELVYRQAIQAALQGDYVQSFEHFLEVVQKHKDWNNDAARKGMLTLFGVLGPKHELTWKYRSKLNTLLFV